MYDRTTVIVNMVLGYRGNMVMVSEGNGITACYSRSYYRIMNEGGEEL